MSACCGQFIEFYDFALYGVSAVVLAALFFPSDDPIASLMSTFAIFGAAFAMRPLGGIFFGRLGDRAGRRPVLFATLLMIGLSTATIGLLPTHESIGALAPLLLLMARLLQGFSAGGEAVGATAFVFEHAPERSRAFRVSICMSATMLPAVVASGLFAALSTSLTEESFMAWGWRVPFLLALPLSVVGLWLRFRTEETHMFLAAKQARTSGHGADGGWSYLGRNWLPIVQVIAITGLTSLCFYMFVAYFPNLVQAAGDLSRVQALLVNGLALLITTLVLPTVGLVSDRIGRRPLLTWGALLIALAAVPAYLMLTSGALLIAFLGQVLFGLTMCIFAGAAFTFYLEVFATGSRLTAAGVGYNVAYALLGGTAPYVASALLAATGSPVMPGVYVAAIAVIVLVVVLATRVPETAPSRQAAR